MGSVAYAAPLLPGGRARLRALASALAGPRSAESDALHLRLGVSAERWYLQATPTGEVLIVYLEGVNLPRAFEVLAGSRRAFDVWFKERVRTVHGIDFSVPPGAALPAKLYQWPTESEEAL